MIKLKSIIIVIIVYLIFYLSMRFDLNILYPYYYLKDIILYPVHALEKEKDFSLSDDLELGINNSLKNEINELKKLNSINIVLSDFNRINATIIEKNREYWFNSVTIDKGLLDGIKKDYAVVDANGLIGRIENVRKHTSDIKLITSSDTKNKVSVLIKDGQKTVYGITRGYNYQDNHLDVVLLSHDEIKKESLVYTTGLGSVFPSGILIGKIDYITRDSDEVTLLAKVILSSDIEGDRYVSVLQREEVSDN